VFLQKKEFAMFNKMLSNPLAFLLLSSVLVLSACDPAPPQPALKPTRITDSSVTPVSPATLENGEKIAFNYKFVTDQTDGVRIFVRPFTAGQLSPDYAASPSRLVTGASGDGDGDITIQTGAVTVDQLRFQIFNPDQSKLLYEEFKPVNYTFKAPVIKTTRFTESSMTPASPATLKTGEKVTVNFKYVTDEVDGVRIFVYPSYTPGLEYSASGIYLGPSGEGTVTFTIRSFAVTVNKLEFVIFDKDTKKALFQEFKPVNYNFVLP